MIIRKGMTKGHAFVYLKKEEDVDKVIEYVDGRHLRNRQIRAHKYNPSATREERPQRR